MTVNTIGINTKVQISFINFTNFGYVYSQEKDCWITCYFVCCSFFFFLRNLFSTLDILIYTAIKRVCIKFLFSTTSVWWPIFICLFGYIWNHLGDTVLSVAKSKEKCEWILLAGVKGWMELSTRAIFPLLSNYLMLLQCHLCQDGRYPFKAWAQTTLPSLNYFVRHHNKEKSDVCAYLPCF